MLYLYKIVIQLKEINTIVTDYILNTVKICNITVLISFHFFLFVLLLTLNKQILHILFAQNNPSTEKLIFNLIFKMFILQISILGIKRNSS